MSLKPARSAALALCLAALPLAATAAPFGLEGAKLSYSPIFAYTDKTGPIYGGATFLMSEGPKPFKIDVISSTNLDRFHSFQITGDRSVGRSRLRSGLLVQRTFDKYYGEGGLSLVSDPVDISQDRLEFDLEWLQGRTGGAQWGPRFRYRARKERGVSGPEGQVHGTLFADEGVPALGMVWENDQRDRMLSPRSGWMARLEGAYLFNEAPVGETAAGAMQAELDLRGYLPGPFNTVLASRANVAGSTGQVPYLFRHRLGGTSQLRGFADNRFRGDHRWLLQQEVRVPVWRMIGMNFSVDAGDVGDPGFSTPKVSWHTGLRVGLPPSWAMKARVDLGFSREGRTMMVFFDEAF